MLEALLLITLACLLWACASEEEQVAEGGIGGTGITAGPINGFGSVIVNGIHFDVDGAQIYVADEQASEEVLRPGMVVTVYGDMNEDGVRGTAKRVDFDFDLIAYVEQLAPDNSWLVAAGETVLIDELTVIEGQPLQVGSGVYVSSLDAGSAGRLARYVGVVAVDEPIGMLSGSGSASSDDAVEAVVSTDETTNFGSVGAVSDLTTPDVSGRSVSVSGLVAQLDPADRFTVQGVTVLITGTTGFIDGDAADLAVGASVLVSGQADSDGLVYADEIHFRSSDSIPLQGEVVAINGSVVTLAGVDVSVQNTTLMLDNSSAAIRRFSVADLALGDKLKVYAYRTDEGLLLTRLERVDSF